ncbi:MAG: phosphatidylglycerophosphatase A [Sphingobacteriia bacterium]|nr:phosphatidylglycerophosphatase A [Sphingobacteriia bacterium]
MVKIIQKIIGSALYTGYSPLFPGTISSLLVLIAYPIIGKLNIFFFVGGVIFIILLALFSYPFFKNSYGEDAPAFTLDEVLATYILLWLIEPLKLNLIAAFILWRLLDIFKPLGIKKVDNIKNISGVMLDDILAVAYTIGISELITFANDKFLF